MDIYGIVLLALAVLSIFELFEHNQRNGIIYIKVKDQIFKWNIKRTVVLLIVIILMMISALRDTSVGRDLMNYIPRYTSLGECSWDNLLKLSREYSFEYGFAVLCKILYLINPNPSFFLIITSVIVAVGFYNLCKISKMPITTLFIIYGYGIYGSSMNIVRQYIAFSVLTFGIKYIIERKPWKYLLIVLIASNIHTISIVFIPLYFLYSIKFNRNQLISVIAISIVLALCGNSMLQGIISKTLFAWYLAGIGKGSGESTLFFLASILFGTYIYRRKILDIDEKDNLCIWGLSSAIIYNAVALHFGIFARVMVFFTPFIAVLIPDCVYAMKRKDEINRYTYMIAGLLVIAFFAFYYQVVLMGEEAEAAGWFPYVLR